FDFCETYVLVQDNMNHCGGGAGAGSIAGLITTENRESVEGVSVQLSGQASQVNMTNVQGVYRFLSLLEGHDYSITPVKDNGYLNGVSTFDLVLISKHILGVEPITSPYKLIAADVNNSRNISILDLIALRKLILSVDTEFTNNTSWRFVDASYNFPNPTNPWSQAFPEVKNINDLVGEFANANFIAIKIGDIDGNARLTSIAGTEVRNIAGDFNFQVADAQLVSGNEYTVDFRAADVASILGYQGTLTFDRNAVELVDIIAGVATAENFGLRFVEQGVITTSWNGAATANDVLFSLVVRAKTDVALSNVLGISSRYTVAEAYNTNSELMNVGIQFNSGTIANAGFELYQNTPNPFKGQTLIGFNLPEAGDATITVSDITGRVIKLVRGNYAQGYNQVTLNSSDLPTGVLTYTLESGSFIATKKMVVVE
ncbi:MAG TPA: T9SS type A sorting domain-containing protein, partial [Saprospiraceae bacterium]|nr:T9SS type A sorting domain-containing protein [Saprospiraceae bacterium]HMP25429.1 T9SS type A sorting domain-containing protein [Saprospiraceae bacterium]